MISKKIANLENNNITQPKEWDPIEEIKQTRAYNRGFIVLNTDLSANYVTPIGDMQEYQQTKEDDFIRRDRNIALFEKEAIDIQKLSLIEDFTPKKTFFSTERLEDHVQFMSRKYKMVLEKTTFSDDFGMYCYSCTHSSPTSSPCYFTLRYYKSMSNNQIYLKFALLEHNHTSSDPVATTPDCQSLVKYFDQQDCLYKSNFTKIPSNFLPIIDFLSTHKVYPEVIYNILKHDYISKFHQEPSFTSQQITQMTMKVQNSNKNNTKPMISSYNQNFDIKMIGNFLIDSDNDEVFEVKVKQFLNINPEIYIESYTESDGRLLAMFVCDKARIESMNQINDAVTLDTGFSDLIENMPITFFLCGQTCLFISVGFDFFGIRVV